MAFPRKYDYNEILRLWKEEGLTTTEIGRIICHGKPRSAKFINSILRNKFGVDVQGANRRKFFGKYRAYPAEEKALWRALRPTTSVQEIVEMRRAAGERIGYSAVHRTCVDIKGPNKVPTMPIRDRLEAKRLYQTYGWHMRDICLRFGFADSTIRKYVGQTDGYHAPARDRQPPSLIHATMVEIANCVLGRKVA